MTDSEFLSQATQSVRKLIPHWPSSSIPNTIRYYRDVLHFKVGDPQHLRDGYPEPTFVSVCMGVHCAANIYFFRRPEGEDPLPLGRGMIGMSTKGLKMYYAILKKEGNVHFVEDLENKAWGYGQFEIKDEDGNILQFFHFLEED
jgi:hypothetical protein